MIPGAKTEKRYLFRCSSLCGVSRRADGKRMQIRSDSRSMSKHFGQIILENATLPELSALLSFNQGQQTLRQQTRKERWRNTFLVSSLPFVYRLYSILQTCGKLHLASRPFSQRLNDFCQRWLRDSRLEQAILASWLVNWSLQNLQICISV